MDTAARYCTHGCIKPVHIWRRGWAARAYPATHASFLMRLVILSNWTASFLPFLLMTNLQEKELKCELCWRSMATDAQLVARRLRTMPSCHQRQRRRRASHGRSKCFEFFGAVLIRECICVEEHRQFEFEFLTPNPKPNPKPQTPTPHTPIY